MTGLTKWNPFKEMDELQNRLSSLLDWSWTPSRRNQWNRNETMRWAEWAPLVDIIEDKNEYLIKAELPEVAKEDVKVNVENRVLTITGDRHFEKEDNDTRYHRVERAYGTFSRSFTLPQDADETRVIAEFKNGLLKVRVAKDEKAKPKAIEVKVS